MIDQKYETYCQKRFIYQMKQTMYFFNPLNRILQLGKQPIEETARISSYILPVWTFLYPDFQFSSVSGEKREGPFFAIEQMLGIF